MSYDMHAYAMSPVKFHACVASQSSESEALSGSARLAERRLGLGRFGYFLTYRAWQAQRILTKNGDRYHTDIRILGGSRKQTCNHIPASSCEYHTCEFLPRSADPVKLETLHGSEVYDDGHIVVTDIVNEPNICAA